MDWRNLRQSAEIERCILSLQEAEIETARIQSLSEDAQNIWNRWSYATEEMYTTGVGSGDTTLLIAAQTAGDTSLSTPRSLSIASAVSSSAFVFFTFDGWERPCAKRSSKSIEKSRRCTFGLVRAEETLRKTIFTTVRQHEVDQQQENGRDPVQTCQNSGDLKKKPIKIEFGAPEFHLIRNLVGQLQE